MVKNLRTVMIILLFGLCMSGCSDQKTDALTHTEGETSSDTTLKTEKGSDRKADEKPEEDPVEIVITKDDRSVPIVRGGKDGGVVEFYYEEALLPDNVRNHEKINKDIENRKDEFFREQEENNWDGVGLDKLLESDADQTPFCYAAVKSIYLDDNYYSLNIEKHENYGGYESNCSFIGCTYDLDTGEVVDLEKILGRSGKELSMVLFKNVGPRIYDYSSLFSDLPIGEDYIDDPVYGNYNYCITQDGKVYLLYDRFTIADDLIGGLAFYIEKYDDSTHVLYSYMKELDAGEWRTLTVAQRENVRKYLNIDAEVYYGITEQTPYFRDGGWYLPVVFWYNDNLVTHMEAIRASAEVDIADPTKIVDTGSVSEEIYGVWYSAGGYKKEKVGDGIPSYCIDIKENSVEIYRYDPSKQCYIKNDLKEIYAVRNTIGGFYAEASYDDGTGKVIYITNEDDPYMLDLYDKPDDIYSSAPPAESLISPRSSEFSNYCDPDCVNIKKIGDNSDSKTLETPKLNDGILLNGPGNHEVHFLWDPVKEADGYIVCSEDLTSEGHSMENPRFYVVHDHYFTLTGSDISYRIRVRAFQGTGKDRKYGAWSEYAFGSAPEDARSAEKTQDSDAKRSLEDGTSFYDEKYAPVLNEYMRVFSGDTSVYGLRVPDDLYCTVSDKLDSFDINDIYYSYFDISGDGICELILLNEKNNDDYVYAVYENGPRPLRMNDLWNKNGNSYISATARDGEGFYLLDNGIICKKRECDGTDCRSYFKLNVNTASSPPIWELIETVAKAKHSDGKVVYHLSDDMESINSSPADKSWLFRTITEDQFEQTLSKYEKKADIERKALSDINSRQ